MGIRKIIYGILQLGAESTATTQATAVIQSTSGSLALVPSGSGAITAAIPDGTAVGGNARGQYAVDLQTSININTQVASGQYSNISGGRQNTSSNTYAVVGGGYSNNNSTLGGTIAGGRSNTINAPADATIGGGNSNIASSNYSTISGGQSNTASTGTHATVVGGQGNTSSGAYSVSGGQTNTASSTNSVALGGNNTASGIGTVAIGRSCSASGESGVSIGYQNTATGKYSNATGVGAQAYLLGMQTYSSIGGFVGNGEAQSSILVPIKSASLTTAATTVLSLDGTGTTNLIIPNGNNRAWKVKVEWIATVTTITGTATGITVGDMAYGEANFGFKKVSGTSVLGNFINDEEASDSAIMDTCSLGYSVGASQELALTFTGPTFAGGGSVTMRVVAKVSLVEVAY